MTPGNRRYRARRWLRWVIVYMACVCALAVIGLVIEAAVNPGKSPKSLTPTAIPTPPWAQATPSGSVVKAAPSPSISATSPALTGAVQVLQGSEEINGVYLGFPHSTVGAVSAADADVTEVISTLDPDRAAAVMRMIADPSFNDAPQQAAEGAVNDRKALGLPASGPVPAGASLQTEPVEYQVRDMTQDQVLVLLLCDFITTVPSQGTTTSIAVFPLQMHWADADWKVESVGGSSYMNLAAEPDSPQSAALGWQQLEPAGG